MTMKRIALLGLAAAALPLAACEVRNADETTAANSAATTADETASAGGVTRETLKSTEEMLPPVQQMPAQAVIQSQPGPDGSQLDLIKVAVTGDVLTVTLRCSSMEKINTEAFRLDDISVIDDATAQRIGILKDNAGNWLASRPSGNSIMADCTVKPGVIWAKFPAPPPTSPTVSINLPGVAPFDGVPVTRG